MAKRPAVHPLQLWMKRNEVSVRDLSERCEAGGHPVSVTYLRLILRGRRRPIWEFAKFLAETMNDGTQPQEFMEFSSPSGERAA